eukprot:scaffold54100_cov18-Prasinocladus_malaysianus.AAC.1
MELDSDSMPRHIIVGFEAMASAMFGFWFIVVISWFFAPAYTGCAWQLLFRPDLVTRQANTN